MQKQKTNLSAWKQLYLYWRPSTSPLGEGEAEEEGEDENPAGHHGWRSVGPPSCLETGPHRGREGEGVQLRRTGHETPTRLVQSNLRPRPPA